MGLFQGVWNKSTTRGIEDTEESVGPRGGFKCQAEDSELDWEGSCEPLKVVEQESNIDQRVRGGRWIK